MDVDPVELAHWKAVAAKPFDEGPRWEYLKWLKLQKDPSHHDRAKFMALQMDAALCRPWDSLAMEAANFRSTKFPLWGPIARGADENPGYEITRWERGFPSALCVHRFPSVASQLDELMMAAPLTSLDVSNHRVSADDKPNLFEFVSKVWFSNLRQLEISADEAAARQLFNEPRLQRLESVKLSALRDHETAPFGYDAPVRALFASPLAKTLREVRILTRGPLSAAALDPLESLPALEHLAVDGSLTTAVLPRLLESAPALRRLELQQSGWLPAVRAWSRIEQLEELVFVGCSVSEVRDLLVTNKLERLKSLRLEHMRDPDPQQFASIFASLNRLQRLSIRRTRLCDPGLHALITSHAFPHLLALELSATGVTDDSVFRLAKTIHMPKLRWVRVHPFIEGLSELVVFALHERWPPANAPAFD